MTVLLLIALWTYVGIYLAINVYAQRSANKESRAYLSVDEMPEPQHRHVTMKSLPPTDAKSAVEIQALVTLRNSGNTPAVNVRLGKFLGLRANPLQKWEEYFPEAQDSIIPFIPAGGEVVVVLTGRAAKEHMKALVRGQGHPQIALMARVKLTYEDVFGETHVQRFQFRVDYRNGRNSLPGWDIV